MSALFVAAEARFAADGFERTTVRSIAESAGVPVGSLYQFYDNKQALFDAVVADYLDALDSVFAEATTALVDAKPVEAPSPGAGPLVRGAVGAIVGGLAQLASERPAFRTLFIGSATSGPFDAASRKIRARAHEHIVRILDTSQHGSDQAGRRRTATICAETIRGLLGTVVDPNGRIDRLLVAELEELLSLYVFHTKTDPPSAST